MERLKLKALSAQRALTKLTESLEIIKIKEYQAIYASLRDSAIQRFEFSSDAFWKFLKEYLIAIENSNAEELTGPRATFRAAQQTHVITLEEFNGLIDMYEDRNKTSHTYEEEISEEIFTNIPRYSNLMENIFNKLKETYE